MRAKRFFLRAGQYCRMFVTAIVLLSLAATAQAQADRQAGIVGIMTDESGAVLPGVTIGRGAVVGANSVVTQDVPPLHVVAGQPARTIRVLTPPTDWS